MKKLLLCLSSLTMIGVTANAKGGKPVAIVYVDPGHGGTDQGIISSTGVSESEINLTFSKNFQLQASGKNVLVEATREEDEYVTNQNRAGIAQGGKGVLISFQTNYSEDASKKGIVIYVASNSGNKEISLKLAEKIKEKLSGLGEVTIAEKSCYVLRNCSVPSVLIEAGYMSNKEELSKLTNDSYVSTFNSHVLSAIVENNNN